MQCRVIDHSLTLLDPLLRAGIEISAQQPSCLSVTVPKDSRFRSKAQVKPGADCFADFWVVPRHHDWPSIDRALQQGQFDRLVIRNHVVVPRFALGFEMKLTVPPADRSPALFRYMSGLQVKATPHVHKGRRDWPLDESGCAVGFNADVGIVPDERADEILEAVDDHFRSGSNLIVMPELSLDEETSRRAALKLMESAAAFPLDASSRLCLIGTAHVVESGPESRRRNRAFVLWGDGTEAFYQDKLGGMTTKKFVEDIDGAQCFHLMLTPFGLVCVLICIDFCNAYSSDAVQLVGLLDVGLVLVPSMGGGSTISAHKAALARLRRIEGPVAVVAQQADREIPAEGVAEAEHFVAVRGEGNLIDTKFSTGHERHFGSWTLLKR